MVALPLLIGFALVPAPARADGTTADFSVSQAVYRGQVGNGAGTPADPSADLLIFDHLTYVYLVSNNGPDAAPFTFELQSLYSSGGYYTPLKMNWSQLSGSNLDDCKVNGYPPGVTDYSCTAAVSEIEVRISLEGNAPGNLTLTGTVTSSATDPDTSNNSATWETSVACSINGTAGDDNLVGTTERDSICGGEGNDHITVGGGDKAFGGPGDDVFDGADDLAPGTPNGSAWALGGPGFDTVSYANADRSMGICRFAASYAVNFKSWSPDAMVDVEKFIGSPYGDFMQGAGGADVLVGGGGKDQLIGRGGSDTLKGGPGSDKFLARNHRVDVIRGGAGSNQAQVDPSDILHSIQPVADAPFVDPCNG